MKAKMKSIKKIVPVFLVTAMMAATITACGSKSGSGSMASGNKAASGSMTSDNKAASGSMTSDNKATSGNMASSSKAATEGEKFPAFKGKDFDGNDVDESIFTKNEVTLVNFWFNGCAACVNEMPALEKFGKKLKEHGAELIGINAGTASTDEGLAEAKDILAKQGATYRNLILPEDHEYVRKIFSFPTTILVDKNGNIVGNPIVGDLEDEKKQEEILKAVEDIKAGNTAEVAKSGDPVGGEFDKLMAQEQEIFNTHKDIWDKVFAGVNKADAEKNSDMPYVDFIKSQIESNMKDKFTADELKTIDEDLAKVAEIEKKIQELNPATDNK